MLTSKEVLDRSGISRATLNNYIARGLLPRPLVKRPAGGGATSPRQLGYFPPDVLETIAAIQKLKRDGLDMEQIAQKLGTPAALASDEQPADSAEQRATSEPPKEHQERLTLTVDELPHAAYMVNYNFEVTWFNTHTRKNLSGVFAELAPRIEDRSIFKLLLETDSMALPPNSLALVRLNLALAKERMTCAAMLQPCRGISGERVKLFEALCDDTAAVQGKLTAEVPLRLNTGQGASDFVAYATYFREGILIVLAPSDGDAAELRRLLGRRDVVIRSLLSKRLPVLTELAVLVADLQESVKICSELPPDEYFELINQIWSVAGDIFRRFYGTHGKHVGDGMVYFFFPQPDSNYVLNAAICAQELKAAIARLSKEWQLKKNWTNELYLNTGLNEGQEWLGTFQTATSIEFVVLGEAINHTARLSDLARFGQIWATKNFISKLPADSRHQVQFGIERVGADGQRVQVSSSYSRVCNLVDVESGRYVKLKDIAGMPVTEILNVTA
jgi:adenylate cyclase